MDNTRFFGTNFFGLLTIAFIVLKLTHVINCSWWLVLSPFWVPIVISVGLMLTAAIIAAVVAIIDKQG